jgi:hypothetical protein
MIFNRIRNFQNKYRHRSLLGKLTHGFFWVLCIFTIINFIGSISLAFDNPRQYIQEFNSKIFEFVGITDNVVLNFLYSNAYFVVVVLITFLIFFGILNMINLFGENQTAGKIRIALSVCFGIFTAFYMPLAAVVLVVLQNGIWWMLALTISYIIIQLLDKHESAHSEYLKNDISRENSIYETYRDSHLNKGIAEAIKELKHDEVERDKNSKKILDDENKIISYGEKIVDDIIKSAENIINNVDNYLTSSNNYPEPFDVDKLNNELNDLNKLIDVYKRVFFAAQSNLITAIQEYSHNLTIFDNHFDNALGSVNSDSDASKLVDEYINNLKGLCKGFIMFKNDHDKYYAKKWHKYSNYFEKKGLYIKNVLDKFNEKYNNLIDQKRKCDGKILGLSSGSEKDKLESVLKSYNEAINILNEYNIEGKLNNLTNFFGVESNKYEAYAILEDYLFNIFPNTIAKCAKKVKEEHTTIEMFFKWLISGLSQNFTKVFENIKNDNISIELYKNNDITKIRFGMTVNFNGVTTINILYINQDIAKLRSNKYSITNNKKDEIEYDKKNQKQITYSNPGLKLLEGPNI